MPTYWNVSYMHGFEQRHASFAGRPSPLLYEVTNRLMGYEGLSPLGAPKRFIADVPNPEFRVVELTSAHPPYYAKNQRLSLHTGRVVTYEVLDVTWHDRGWHYWVEIAGQPSAEGYGWVAESTLSLDRLVD